MALHPGPPSLPFLHPALLPQPPLLSTECPPSLPFSDPAPPQPPLPALSTLPSLPFLHQHPPQPPLLSTECSPSLPVSAPSTPQASPSQHPAPTSIPFLHPTPPHQPPLLSIQCPSSLPFSGSSAAPPQPPLPACSTPRPPTTSCFSTLYAWRVSRALSLSRSSSFLNFLKFLFQRENPFLEVQGLSSGRLLRVGSLPGSPVPGLLLGGLLPERMSSAKGSSAALPLERNPQPPRLTPHRGPSLLAPPWTGQVWRGTLKVSPNPSPTPLPSTFKLKVRGQFPGLVGLSGGEPGPLPTRPSACRASLGVPSLVP